MAQASRGRSEVPGGFGRSFLIGGSVVAAGLASTWLLMLNHQKREEAAGKNPYHEQIVAQLSKKDVKGEELRPLHADYSDIPPAFPGKDHHSGHMTIAKARSSPDFDPETRYQQPTPQRARRDNPDQAYTKSPDFAKNYGKTEKARQVVLHPQPGQL